MRRRVVIIGLSSVAALFALLSANAFAAENQPATFDCRWTERPLTIDGKVDEDAWKSAQLIEHFYLPWLRDNPRRAKTATKAKLLWDREYLYFSAKMEDNDLYADVKEHDGKTWHNDVFELFFKPATDKPGYYEFQVNAAGTVMDLFLPRRGAGGFQRFIDEREFHIDAKVQLDGSLNKWQDTDRGWTVEGRIPWRDFLVTGGRPAVGEQWKFALCRYDYSVDFEGPELSTCAPLKTKVDFHRHEEYATLIFRSPDKQSSAKPPAIEGWSPVTTSRVAGSPDPPLPYTTRRAYPKLQLDFPVFMIREPVSRRLYFIDQERQYGETRLCRTKGDPASGEYEVLVEFEKTVAYSLCFHPQFEKNGFLYLGANAAWREGEPKKSRVTRYQVDRQPPHKLDPASATTIIEWESNGHNGAAVAFGLDGMLFVTSGDGTSDSDDNVAGQGLDHLLAKVLRIDVDRPSPGRPYSIPADNPFTGQEDVAPETWAYGMRNPWRMTVDQKTGHVWVGNNGQDLWEQAYLVEKGANYGWSVYEGSHPFYLNRRLGPHPHSKPTVEHSHSESRSLTGGVVYYGTRLPELRGAYIYGDHSTGKIWGVKHDGEKTIWARELADTPFNITAFALDSDGELLVADHRGGGKGGFYSLVANDKSTRDRDAFPRKLSDSGLFQSVKDHQMAKGLIPYSVNSPLWSDGAFQARWIALPPALAEDGKPSPNPIEVQGNRSWSFPDGTVVVKSLGLEMSEGDPTSRRWVETQFLSRQQGEWVGYSYAWNNEQTDALLVEPDGRNHAFQIRGANGDRRTQTWRYSGRTECMVCHSRAANYVLGLSTLQMNKEHDYGAVAENQLRVLEHLGVLRINWSREVQDDVRKQLGEQGMERNEIDEFVRNMTATRNQRNPAVSTLFAKPPEQYESLVDPYDSTAALDSRARSYLHANCAHCHVPAGGGNAQMELEFATAPEKTKIFDAMPVHSKFGMLDAKLVARGDPFRSVLLLRMSKLGGGRMPRLGSTVVDERAVGLVHQWITNLAPDPDNPPPDSSVARQRKRELTSLEKLRTSADGAARQQAAERLLATTSGALMVLRAMDQRAIVGAAREEIIHKASAHAEPQVRELFEKFLPEEKRIKRLGSVVKPSEILTLRGDNARGEQVFFQTAGVSCQNCHQIGGKGKELGPDLSQIGKKYNRQQILESLLEPSRIIDPKFLTIQVETTRGRVFTGLLVEKTAAKVVLKDNEHKLIELPRQEIELLVPQQKSLMPELLLRDMTREQVADLLEFLSSLK